MTLIAIFKYKYSSIPIFIGDALLSQNFKPSDEINLPSHGNVGFPKTSEGDYIGGLEQKLIVINKKLIICWAGDRGIAKAICNDFYTKFNKEFSENEIFEYLKSMEKHMADNKCALIVAGALKDEAFVYSHNATIINGYKNFKTCHVTGTGRNDFLDYFSNHSSYVPEIEESVEAKKHNNFNAILDTVNLLSRFYFGDLFELKTLESSFGGMHEIATLHPTGGFRKVDDILISFVKHDCKTDSSGEFKIFGLHIKYDVIDNLSLVRTLKYKIDKDGIEDVEEFANIIPSFIDEHINSNKELAKDIMIKKEFYGSDNIVDFDAKFNCVFLNIVEGDKSFMIPLVQYKENRNTWVKIKSDSEGISIVFDDRLVTKIKDKLNKHVDSENKKIII